MEKLIAAKRLLEWVMVGRCVEVCLPLAFGLFVSQIGRGSDIVHHALSDEAAIEVLSVSHPLSASVSTV